MNLKNQLNLKIEIACDIIGNTHTLAIKKKKFE